MSRRPGRVDRAIDDGAVRHDQSWRGDVAVEGRARFQLDAVRNGDIADHCPADQDRFGDEVGRNRCALTDDHAVIADLDRALDFAVDSQILAAEMRPSISTPWPIHALIRRSSLSGDAIQVFPRHRATRSQGHHVVMVTQLDPQA